MIKKCFIALLISTLFAVLEGIIMNYSFYSKSDFVLVAIPLAFLAFALPNLLFLLLLYYTGISKKALDSWGLLMIETISLLVMTRLVSLGVKNIFPKENISYPMAFVLALGVILFLLLLSKWIKQSVGRARQ